MLALVAQTSSTELNKTSGKVLDLALQGPVRIVRRNQNFIVMREEELEQLLAAAGDPRPKTLQELLAGYDPEKIKNLTGEFLSGPPAGKEML